MNLQELAGAVIYLGLKTVEQHENIVAENYFDFIVEKCDISSQLLLKVSEKMLEFAKKFKTEYPNLLNLKKFNPI